MANRSEITVEFADLAPCLLVRLTVVDTEDSDELVSEETSR